MRPLAWVLLLAGAALGADRLVLRNGGELVGHVIEEDDARVVLESGGMRLVLPRSSVERIEREVDAPVPERAETLRDEWFARGGEGDVIGWRHLVETRTSSRCVIQVRDVYRDPNGGTCERRRVEETTPGGDPLAILLVEAWPHAEHVARPGGQRIVSGRSVEGGIEVRRLDENGAAATTVAIEGAWTFRDSAIARFLRGAPGPDEAAIPVYEPRLGLTTLRLERLADRPGAAPPVRRFRVREGDEPEWIIEADAGGGVLARVGELRRVSAGHADLIRRALHPQRPMDLEEALLHPLQRERLEPPDRERIQLPAGLAVELPSDAWTVVAHARSEGLVWTFENDVLLASLEVFAFPLPAPDADPDACLADAWRRLGRVVGDLQATGEPETREIGGYDARVASFSSSHRAEDVAGVLAVVRADARLLMLVAGCPPDGAGPMRAACDRFFDTLVVAPIVGPR